jgi:hypothetical protein
MKTLALPVAIALCLSSAGCVLVAPRSSRSAVQAEKGDKKCPPGHLWSDGKCHSKGKGHDK